MTETETPVPKKIFTPRNVARFVVGNATRFVVVTLITTYVPAETKLDKVRLYVGSYAIGELAANKTRAWINQEIDEVIEAYDSLKDHFKEVKDETPDQ